MRVAVGTWLQTVLLAGPIQLSKRKLRLAGRCAAALEIGLQQMRQRVDVMQLAVLDTEEMGVGCSTAAWG